MAEKEPLGKYVQRRIREKGIEDKIIADILNLSVKTVPKVYAQTDIPCDRIAKLSILLNEDLYLNYYSSSEPLKTILNREKQELNEKILELESQQDQYLNIIKDKDSIIILQNKLISELEEKLKK
ncbi:MAG: hypothetical protein LBF27_01370 [Sphingobacterium sp.]|jgi:hypothetical protein|nr:hypothetical protein [Sphingobacterium sp.]